MSNSKKIAALFSMLCKKYDGADNLGKKASQKIFYFFERKGIPLNLRYGIHFFGPYSEKLDTTMHLLESEDYINIDTNGLTHVISLGAGQADMSYLSEEETKIANEVLDLFAHKTPRELEALTTLDYIANTILSGNPTEDEIINNFKKIKGDKFNQTEINIAMKDLKSEHFVNV